MMNDWLLSAALAVFASLVVIIARRNVAKAKRRADESARLARQHDYFCTVFEPLLARPEHVRKLLPGANWGPKRLGDAKEIPTMTQVIRAAETLAIEIEMENNR